MNKLISVIIPVYNVEKYLVHCLESVIGQTYKNLQIILVDDGSTDHSPAICDEYAKKDGRIEVIHQKNGGLPAARNCGLKYARGEYIGFVDSDDWIHLDMYKHLAEILEKYNADMSTVECYKTDGDIGIEKQDSINIKVLSQKEYAKTFFKIGEQKIVYYVWNRLYKKEILEKNHFEERFTIGEDVVATYKILLKVKQVAVSNQNMYFYRQTSGMTSFFHLDYFRLEDVWNRVEEIDKANGNKYKEYVNINQSRINFTILAELAIRGEYKNKRYLNQIKQLLQKLKEEKKKLLCSDIAFSRKLIIIMFCINYKISSSLLYCLKKI